MTPDREARLRAFMAACAKLREAAKELTLDDREHGLYNRDSRLCDDSLRLLLAQVLLYQKAAFQMLRDGHV